MDKQSYDIGLKSAKASLTMEGLEVSEKQEALVFKYLNGEITEKTFKEENMKLATNV